MSSSPKRHIWPIGTIKTQPDASWVAIAIRSKAHRASIVREPVKWECLWPLGWSGPADGHLIHENEGLIPASKVQLTKALKDLSANKARARRMHIKLMRDMTKAEGHVRRALRSTL